MIDNLQYISQPSGRGSHLPSIRKALEAGCRWIQLRVKEEPPHRILEEAQQASEICMQFGARLIINDYPEIALKAGAYGIHLGLDDMSLSEARKITGATLVTGGTANTFAHIEQRAAERVDYVGLGPFRFTTTKKKLSPILGLAGYSAIMKQVRQKGIRVPIIAIGGIELADIAGILQTGIYGVAISGAITRSKDAVGVVAKIKKLLDQQEHSTIHQ